MAERSTATTIDEYIAEFPPEVQAAPADARADPRIAPEATETISYAIPTFDLNGKHLVHFAGVQAPHRLLSDADGIEAFAEELRRTRAARARRSSRWTSRCPSTSSRGSSSSAWPTSRPSRRARSRPHRGRTRRRGVRALEEALWRPETRQSPEWMDVTLAEEFVEFGASGRVHSRASVVRPVEGAIDVGLPLPEFSASLLRRISHWSPT